MNLALPQKYFPKTLKYLQSLKPVNANLFIKKYHLGGLKLLNEATNKVAQVTTNLIDTSDVSVYGAIKVFNQRIHASENNSFQIFYHKGSALIGHNIYNQLTDFVDNHWSVPENLNDYIDRDRLINDLIKRHGLTGFCLTGNGFVGLDVYVPHSKFHFTVSQLRNMATSLYNHDVKQIKKFNKTSVVKALMLDVHKFNTQLRPALRYFMFVNKTCLKIYNKEIVRGKLLSYLIDKLKHN